MKLKTVLFDGSRDSVQAIADAAGVKVQYFTYEDFSPFAKYKVKKCSIYFPEGVELKSIYDIGSVFQFTLDNDGKLVKSEVLNG